MHVSAADFIVTHEGTQVVGAVPGWPAVSHPSRMPDSNDEWSEDEFTAPRLQGTVQCPAYRLARPPKLL